MNVEIGMRGEKAFLLRHGSTTKAIDIMVAVALGVADADQCAEREILLHAEPGLAGEILSGDEEWLVAAAPCRHACGIENGFLEPLACL